jgi:Tfp pilus assembly PilM family ATPase
MFSFLKSQTCPIGIDVGSGTLNLAQMGWDNDGLYLLAGANDVVPDGIEYGTGTWQRWAVSRLKAFRAERQFRGRDVVATLPGNDVFIDQVKVPRVAPEQLREAVLSRIAPKLPCEPKECLVQYVVTREGTKSGAGELDVLVMAAERTKVDRHLAVYENANLKVVAIGVWPLALTASYVTFFGRRTTDRDDIAMLLEIRNDVTHVAICKHKDLLFARLVPVGRMHLTSGEAMGRLILEIAACQRHFESISGMARIDRILLFAGQNVEKVICDNLAQLAQKMQVAAQLADVTAAVEMRMSGELGVDRRSGSENWATAFGLGLSLN